MCKAVLLFALTIFFVSIVCNIAGIIPSNVFFNNIWVKVLTVIISIGFCISTYLTEEFSTFMTIIMFSLAAFLFIEGLPFNKTKMENLKTQLYDKRIVSLKIGKNLDNTKKLPEIASLLEGSSLETLNISSTKLNDEGIEILAEKLPTKTLRHLDISNNDITFRGAIQLAKNLQLQNIQTLILNKNQIGDRGFKEILQSLKGSSITAIHASDIDLTNDCVETLLNILPTLKNLKNIDLSHNRIGPKGLDKIEEIKSDTLSINTNDNHSNAPQKTASISPKGTYKWL